MLRLYLVRAAIFAVPFIVYWIWRDVARRTGREMGSTPWAWLVAAGAILAASTLLFGTALQPSRPGRYVPAEARPDGSVVPGHYVSPKT